MTNRRSHARWTRERRHLEAERPSLWWLAVMIPFLVWFNFVAERQAGQLSVPAPSQEGHAAGLAVSATPIHGVTQRGELFFCYPDQPKVTEFCLILR